MNGTACIPVLIFSILAYTQARSVRAAAGYGACYGVLLGVLVGLKVGWEKGEVAHGLLWGTAAAAVGAPVVAAFASLGWLIGGRRDEVRSRRPAAPPDDHVTEIRI